MLLIHTASHLEAKPLIEHYQLKRNLNFNHFELYQGKNNNNLYVIISGIGKLAAATAISSALSFLEFHQKLTNQSRLINFGLAGSTKNIDIQSIYLINQITDFANKKSYYPEVLFKSLVQKKSLISFDQAVNQEDHPELVDTLVDMEASAVFYAANKWLTSDRIHVIKVVADHLSCQEFKANNPVQLIAEASPKIFKLITDFLEELKVPQQVDWKSSPLVIQLCSDLQLSNNQQQQLIKIINQYETCCEASFAEFLKLFHYKTSEHKSLNAKTFQKLLIKLEIEIAKATTHNEERE